MAGGFPLGLEICNGKSGVLAAGSSGIAITASGSTNTKGAYTTLIASTAFDACWMGVTIDVTSGTGTFLVDIAIGAAASEKVVVNNLAGCAAFVNEICSFYFFPITVPAGTRISARGQSNTASAGCNVAVQLFDGSFTQMEGAAGVDSIGALTASSHGTTITAGASNTKGSYTSLGVTARDYMGLLIGLDNQVSPSTDTHFLLDIALGAGGSQQVIIPDVAGFWDNVAYAAPLPASWGPYFISVPNGTNLWARCQTGSGSSTIDVSVYGIYQ
jgi:hypothetical protein